ncbi:MAG: MATE family efflux transporter [Eubacterium coprostanoligenes]|uniref:MATE family efflux transporter n=1 Tax=Eubacterium coprostanoligenes TaxID=290054 RepID=UPI0023F447E9|nr:MATE family efflux transporter [Eubacterium coprostanoligenes]MDD7357376.1 MATE family efflux transporter [Eubacterium coprostanoligenes]
MTEGNIWKLLIIFSIPLILGNLLQQMYNTADSIIVGNFVGSNGLAAVGSGTALINLIIAFSQGAAVGAGVIVSQNLGARDKQKTKLAVHTAMCIAIILGVILSAIGVIFSRDLLIWMKTPKSVLKDSVLYLQIYCGGLIFNIIYNMATGILNAAGNSKRPLIYLAIASVTNIILDLVFIKALKWGVKGAAIATDISQALSCVLAVGYLLRVNSDYKLTIKELKIHGNTAKQIIRVGLPTAIQNMVISFSNVLVQSSVNSYGATAMAGYAAYLKIDGFNILPVLSISMAVTTFTGQNVGAKKPDRIKKGMWTALIMGVVYTVIIGVVILLTSHTVLGLFTKDNEVITYGQLAMKYFCPFYFLLGILNILAGTVRGAGKGVPPMLILLFSMCIFRILWIKIALPFYSTIDGVFILYPISWFVGMVLMIIYTKFGKWLPKGLNQPKQQYLTNN